MPLSEISTIGNGNAIKNGAALIVDGVTPDEVITWNGEKSVSWSGKGKWIALDFDQEYALHDLVLYSGQQRQLQRPGLAAERVLVRRIPPPRA